ncbi:hypothetical protein D3C81_1484520 [compost metagenome]
MYMCVTGDITTSWPSLAAFRPPSVPRHDITVASGGRPPSRISSQPIRRRSCCSRNFSRRLIMWLCISISSFRPSWRMCACTRLDAIHWSFTASSPPTCTYLAGNMVITSSSTFSMNCRVLSSVLNRFGSTPHSLEVSSFWPVTPSSGYAAMAAVA